MKSDLKTKDLYFGVEVDEAIVQFASETNPKIRSKIFEAKIYPAFEKLSRYHYHKLPVARNEEVISECVVFLFEQLHKFDPSKNSRGFPYFNIIAKHFYIGKLKSENKEISHDNDLISLDDSSTSDLSENLMSEEFVDQIESDQFIEIFKKQLPIWHEKFSKDHEKKIVGALMDMFENPDSVDIFKKKAIFLYLKEQTNLNSKQIAINLSKIKKKFEFLKSKYNRGEF